jgi:hypothetical protein
MKTTQSCKLIVPFSSLLVILACQPVIAIGWREILFITILAALLIGPPVYRFFRRLEKARGKNRK